MRIPENGGIWGCYERLSREDEAQGDSNSIINQRRILEQYALDRGVTNIRHYTDDGYSGANFERPAWKQLMEDVESGKISTIIAKDMSRIGRNYLEVGYYTEIYFPQKRVRFIAINNNVDSNVQGSDDFAPFLNIMNEHMVRETSRKIKAVMRMKGKEGKHLGGIPPYGYKTDPEDKSHWIIDEEAAKVVRHIYQLCIEGHGPYQIAGILEQEKIEIPGYYLAKQGLGNHQTQLGKMKPYVWAGGTVGLILSRIEYMGHTVSFRTFSESYKTKKQIKNDPSEWVIVENTQEAIIDKETWELVQKLRQTTRRTDTTGEANPLTGLVFCSDCGAKMRNRRAKGEPLKSDPTRRMVIDDCYLCSRNANAVNRREKVCSAHRISTTALKRITLEVIRAARQSAVEDEAAFREKLAQESQTQQKEAVKALEKKLHQDKKRYDELDNLMVSLFEANATHKISDRRFQMMNDRYEQEQAEVETAILDAERQLAQYQTDSQNVDRFLELAQRYTDFTELTTPMLNHFIDKIVVHESEKVDGERTQEVEVYLNYIGRFELPKRELTAEELAQLEKDKKRRADSRERCKRYRERKKAKKLQEQANAVKDE